MKLNTTVGDILLNINRLRKLLAHSVICILSHFLNIKVCSHISYESLIILLKLFRMQECNVNVRSKFFPF